jgi:hypothetical protein
MVRDADSFPRSAWERVTSRSAASALRSTQSVERVRSYAEPATADLRRGSEITRLKELARGEFVPTSAESAEAR